MPLARWLCSTMSSSAYDLPARSAFASSNCAFPEMTARGLLISWAAPAILPTLTNRSVRRSLRRSALLPSRRRERLPASSLAPPAPAAGEGQARGSHEAHERVRKFSEAPERPGRLKDQPPDAAVVVENGRGRKPCQWTRRPARPIRRVFGAAMSSSRERTRRRPSGTASFAVQLNQRSPGDFAARSGEVARAARDTERGRRPLMSTFNCALERPGCMLVHGTEGRVIVAVWCAGEIIREARASSDAGQGRAVNPRAGYAARSRSISMTSIRFKFGRSRAVHPCATRSCGAVSSSSPEPKFAKQAIGCRRRARRAADGGETDRETLRAGTGAAR